MNVRLILDIRRNVATVPAQTVEEGPDGHFAYVINPDNTVERRAVDVTSTQDGIAVIAKGLSTGERVVVDGQYRLTDGARVRILPSRSTSRRVTRSQFVRPPFIHCCRRPPGNRR